MAMRSWPAFRDIYWLSYIQFWTSCVFCTKVRPRDATFTRAPFIGVDLAGILRGTHGERRRWVGAEWGGVWWGVSPLQPTRESGGASWAPPAGSGTEPRPKTDFGVFWGPQNAPFCIYMTKIWGAQFAVASPTPNSGGGTCPPRPPRDLRPWLHWLRLTSLWTYHFPGWPCWFIAVCVV